jgi:hypothetical protein
MMDLQNQETPGQVAQIQPQAAVARSEDIPPPPYAGMTSLPVGDVLASSFNLSFKYFIPFMVISAIALSPILLWGLTILMQEDIYVALENLGFFGRAAGFLTFVCQQLAAGSIIFAIILAHKGESFSIGKCLSVGMRSILPLIGYAFLLGLIMFGIALPVIIAAVVGGGFGGFVMILVIPVAIAVVIVTCAAYVSAPAVVVEKLGPRAALKRSFELTRDNRLRIFGIVLVLGLINHGIDFVITKSTFESGEIKTYLVLYLVTMVVFTIIQTVATARTYLMLKLGREGADVEDLAAVFD